MRKRAIRPVVLDARRWAVALVRQAQPDVRRAAEAVDRAATRVLLPGWAAPLAIAAVAMLVVQSIDHRYIRGSLGWSLFITGALATMFVALYCAVTQRRDVLVPARTRPALAVLMALLAGNTVLHCLLLVPHLLDTYRYNTDAGAATDCATQMALHGQDPYINLHMLTCLDRHHLAFNQTTPISEGAFKPFVTFASPVTAKLEWVMWRKYYEDLAKEERDNHYPYHYAAPEFEERFNYPAGSLLFGMLAWLVGARDLVALFLVCAVGASLWVYRQAHPRIRAATGLLLLADLPLLIDSSNGVTDVLYACILVLYWRFRERVVLAGMLLGLGAATRQQVWFFAPFLLYLAWRTGGWADFRARAASAVAVFLACNLPFIIQSPLDWLAGVLGPMTDPMFAQGVGLITLSIAVFKQHPGIPLLYTALEAVAYLAAFRWFMRRCLAAPGLAMVLPLLPIALAWRSLHTYFVILPLLALAVLTCPPNGSDAEVVSWRPRLLPRV